MHPFSVGYEADNSMIAHIHQIRRINPPKIMRVNDCPGGREIVETQIIKNCMSSYFNIVRKHIADLVPKAIMAFLINKTKDNSLQILFTNLSDEDEIVNLMSEDPMIKEIRNEWNSTIKALQGALNLLNEARNFNYFKEIEKSEVMSKQKMRIRRIQTAR